MLLLFTVGHRSLTVFIRHNRNYILRMLQSFKLCNELMNNSNNTEQNKTLHAPNDTSLRRQSDHSTIICSSHWSLRTVMKESL